MDEEIGEPVREHDEADDDRCARGQSQQQFRVGDLVNVLLYIPVRKELELLKCASEVVWVQDLSGSWMCGAAFRKFAPGDERRLREWLLECVRAQKAGLSLSLPSPDEIEEGD